MLESLLKSSVANAGSHLDVGARLKIVREQNGLSQRELAKRAHVTHSSISMIEQGQNSPSINSLEKILSGVPMTLTQFFVCDPTVSNPFIYRAGELPVSQQKFGISIHNIPHKLSANNLHFQKVILSCGADTGATPLIVNQMMSGFIISGQLELTANTQVSLLKVDDAFTLSASNAYRLRNLSTQENCVLLTCEL